MVAEHRIRTLTDPHDLRALAHPLRLQLLGALRLDGPATASSLARRLGVSSGLTSYHLRALAERGFVEDDPEHPRKRERWWRACHDMHAWAVTGDGGREADAGGAEAARALGLEVARIYGRRLEAWAATAPELDERWHDAVAGFDRSLTLPPERLARLVAEIEAVIERYAADDATDDGADRVGLIFAAFPDPAPEVPPP